jgi:catechol 2,3-dioxygenase-like lactoylglutathione lyase family enzyme
MRISDSLLILPASLIFMVSLAGPSTPPANPLHLRAHHITANVADLDRAAAWYQRMLGFTVVERGQHGALAFVELAAGEFGVALIKNPSTTATANERTNVPHWVHIVFAVPDPNATYRLLQSKGATVHTRDDIVRGPVRSFLVKDSEGNEIEIVGESQ